MTKLNWDLVGERRFETGVANGVLFPTDTAGVYQDGVAWNGLTGVTESPSGAESNKQYADNQVYVNLLSLEMFGGTIEAFMSPPAFDVCDGSSTLVAGVTMGQQSRRLFGLCYRTLVGNDVLGSDFGGKLHIVYGAQVSPSEKSYSTVNDTPEPMGLSWDFTTTPIDPGTINSVVYKPTASLVIDETLVGAVPLQALKDILWGTVGANPRLPLPAEVYTVINASGTVVNMNLDANKPTFVSATGVITLPAVTGVQWKINGVNKAAGAQPAIPTATSATVQSTPLATYTLTGDTDSSFYRP